MSSLRNSENDLIAIINPQGEIIYRNVNFLKFSGEEFRKSDPKFLGKLYTDGDESNTELYYELNKKINISFKEGILTNMDYHSSNKGEHIKLTCNPIINEDNIVECVILNGTKIESAENSNSSGAELFSPAFYHHIDCTPELLIIDIVSNKGYDKNAIINKSIEELFPKTLFQTISEQIKNFETSEGFSDRKLDFVSDDKSVHVDIKVFRRNDKLTIILEDLTDQTYKDSELRKYVEELHYNKIISEQYAKELSLVNKKLNESEEELKKLNMDKDKFFSIVAHDLRSPFSSLLGFSDYLSKEADKLEMDEIKSYAKSIFTTGRHLLALLENLLQWSRVQLGRIEFTPEVYNLSEQLESLSEYFQHIAIQKNIKVVLTAPAKLNIIADKNMIETVLRNFLSNALKFTRDGGEINLRGAKKKKYAEIRVQDNGVGMSSENINKLFRIDSQLTTVGTRNEKGSGLGLLISKEFAEKNNSEISVESKLGKGTTFILRIPIGSQSSTKEKKQTANKAQKTSGYQFSK